MTTRAPQAGVTGPPAPAGDEVSPERIAEIVKELSAGLGTALKNINEINRQTRLLSLNARMEAQRGHTGDGAAFAVVARAMGDLAVRTDEVATALGERSNRSIRELERVNHLLGTNARGVRLSDLALAAIDLIDRNLYERSCDVRWWATDASVVAAVAGESAGSRAEASRRLGVILDSYTVYFDLVVCDTRGVVVANGRPTRYPSAGLDCSNDRWFRSAIDTRTGAEFGFQSVHESPLAGGRRVLVYSCAVRTGGESAGKPLGVLGIVFDWDALAQTIVERVPLSDDERRRTRVCITDGTGLVLADSHGKQLRDTLVLPARDALFAQAKNFVIGKSGDRQVCIAHAKSPGFETYATGWHAVIQSDF